MTNPSEDLAEYHRTEDVTEDLPAELLQFAAYAREANAAPALSIVPDSDEEDEPTIVEILQQPIAVPVERAPFPERLKLFLTTPYNPHPWSEDLKQYFREVRQRIIESHEYDKVHYADTLYQRGVRLAIRAYRKMKANIQAY